jgi:hypothetical protein
MLPLYTKCNESLALPVWWYLDILDGTLARLSLAEEIAVRLDSTASLLIRIGSHFFYYEVVKVRLFGIGSYTKKVKK